MVNERPLEGACHSRASSRSRNSARRQPYELATIETARSFDDHHAYSQRTSRENMYPQMLRDEEMGESSDHAGDVGEKFDADDEEKEDEEVRGSSELEDSASDVRGRVPSLNQDKAQSTRSRRSSKSAASKHSSTSPDDPNLVTWDGPDDPQNPLNWSKKRKWAATFVVSSFTFISPVSSSIVAPVFPLIAKDLHITSQVELAMTLSIFVLAYAVGPLIMGPTSEIYGRARVLQLSNLFYLVWNMGCSFAQSKEQLIAFRFLSGLGGSAPLSIGGGVLGDCWSREERGKAISIYTLAPLLGPALGPIAGGFIAENASWRWTFWSTSIATALVQIFGLFFLQETYAPLLLERKARRLRKETGNVHLHTADQDMLPKSLLKVLRHVLIRPFRLLFTQPIVQIIAIYMAYLYGLLYLVLTSFAAVWTDWYHESVAIGSLNYLSLGIGFFIGSQFTARFNDRIYIKLKQKNNNVGQPEFRIPLMFIGSWLVPIGILWYGWSAQYHIHWVVPNIGAAILAAGSIMLFQCLQSYLIDTYTKFAASALAAVVTLRSMAGFGFPLFGSRMYQVLNYGWGNSVLGLAGLVIGLPAPFLFWFYGARLRQMSQYAAG